MRVCYLVLATAAALLTSANAYSEPIKHSVMSSADVQAMRHSPRHLRIAGNDDSDDSDDEGDDSSDADDSEERMLPTMASLKRLTSKTSTLSEKMAASVIKESVVIKEMEGRTQLWVQNLRSPQGVKATLGLAGLSDEVMMSKPLYKVYQKFLSPENIKTALGFDKLSDEAIKASSHYKYYLELMAAHTDDVLNNWVKQEVSTFKAWQNLGLDKLSAAELQKSADLKTYVQYVVKIDKNHAALLKNAAKETSEAEMKMRLKVWKINQKSEEFVKTALGIDKLSGTALTKANKYLEEFLKM